MDNHVHLVMSTSSYHRNSNETTTRLNESMDEAYEVETSDSIHSIPVPSHRGRAFRDFVVICRGSFPRLKKQVKHRAQAPRTCANGFHHSRYYRSGNKSNIMSVTWNLGLHKRRGSEPRFFHNTPFVHLLKVNNATLSHSSSSCYCCCCCCYHRRRWGRRRFSASSFLVL